MNNIAHSNDQNSVETTTSTEESTTSCEMMTEIRYSEEEEMEYQQLHDCIAANNNEPDVTYGQTEPLSSETQGRYVITIFIIISLPADIDLTLNNNTASTIEDPAITIHPNSGTYRAPLSTTLQSAIAPGGASDFTDA